MKFKKDRIFIGLTAFLSLTVAQSATVLTPLEPDALAFGAYMDQQEQVNPYSVTTSLSFNQNSRLSLTEGMSIDTHFPVASLQGNKQILGFSRLNDQEQHAGLSLRLGQSQLSYSVGQGFGFSRLSNQYSNIDPYYFHGGSNRDFSFNALEWTHQFNQNSSFTVGRADVNSTALEDRSTQFVGGQLGRVNAHFMRIERGDSKAGQAFNLGFDLPQGAVQLSTLKQQAGGEINQLSLVYQSNSPNKYHLAFSQQSNPLIGDDQSRIMFGVSRKFGNRFINAAAGSQEQEPKPKKGKFIVLGGLAVGAAISLSSGSDEQDNAIRFTEQHAAAKKVLNNINPVSVREDREYGGWVYKTPDNRYLTTTPIRGQRSSVSIPQSLLPANATALASYHTHSALSPEFITEQFSPADISSDQFAKVDGYLGTPLGSFLWHSHRENKVRRLGSIAH